LITKAQEKVAGGEQDDAVREERCGGWAADAAKHAVQVLLATEGGDVAAANDAGEERDEMARRSSNDEEAGQEEAPEGENEDHEDESGAANKSSDEFVSMEDEDEGEGEEDGVRMPARAALSSESPKPGHSELGNGEEMANIRSGHHHPELDQAEGGGDDSVQADDETRDGEGMCHDAIQQQVEEQSSSSWEDIDGSTRRQSTPPVMATGKDAPTGSRKKREAVSRSSKPSKPRWHV
jgi:exocyst complex component 8